jgi:hypothetical protein
MSKCVRESFFYRSQLLTELLEDKQIAKLWGSYTCDFSKNCYISTIGKNNSPYSARKIDKTGL